MPSYKYVVRKPDGTIKEGVQDAVSQDEIVALFHEKNYTVISINRKAIQKTRVKKRRLNMGVGSEDLVLYSRQLAVLLGAGIPLLRTLTILSNQIASKPLFIANEQVISDIESGFSFKDALAKHKRLFSNLWLNLVETGEVSGQMPTIMSRLADHLEAVNELKSKIISALIYPALLIVGVIGVIVFMLLFLVPIFSELYADMGVELPQLTQMVMNASEFLKTYIVLIIGVVVVFFIFLQVSIRTKQGKFVFDSFCLKLPVFGRLFQMQMENEFTSGLSILIRSGVPILQGIDILSRTSNNAVAERVLSDVKDSIREGKTIAVPLERAGLYSDIVVQMVSVGEETGELAGLLEKAFSFTKSRLDNYVVRLASLIEPFIILSIGLVVGVVAFAVYVPIFQLITTMPGA